jgi:hypothetical protein
MSSGMTGRSADKIGQLVVSVQCERRDNFRHVESTLWKLSSSDGCWSGCRCGSWLAHDLR